MKKSKSNSITQFC